VSTLNPEEWQALSPYLDQALAMTDDERAAWVCSLAEENPDVAAQLAALLDEHRVLVQEGFLENGRFELPGSPGLAGQSLGPYTLISQIGQGGMGSVWLAERTDGRFERRVAVKFLNISLIGKDGEARFKREGSILGKLAHPHIADLIDAGVSVTGQPYLVLEYVPGHHIDRYCDENKLGIEARIRLFLDVLVAVADAHSNLIVHRDLKPSNVFVSNAGEVKLLDFGIAKLLESEGEQRPTAITVEGRGAMTPEYASPEQLTGAPVTTATDVYALGVLLYVLLTGQHPAGSNLRSAADLVRAIVDTEPARPSEAVALITGANSADTDTKAAQRTSTPDKLSRLLRGDLDTIVAKALKKNPSERYGSVTALADDLNRYLRHEPIKARPDALAYRSAKFVRRNRTAVALAAVAIVGTAVGLVGAVLQTRTARAQRDFAIRQLSRAERIDDLNQLLLTEVGGQGNPLTVNELLQRAERVVEHEPIANDPANHVELLISIGELYSLVGDNERGLHVLDQAYRLSRGLSEPSTRAKASCSLSTATSRKGELAKAESLIQEGLRELSDEPRLGPARIFCLLRGMNVATDNGSSQLAVERARAAEQAFKESPAESVLVQLDVLQSLGANYAYNGQFLESNRLFERADALMSSFGYDQTQRASSLLNSWAMMLTQAGQPLEAEKAYRRAIEIRRTSQSEEIVLPAMLYNYGIALSEIGHLDEAADYTERALAKAQQAGNQIIVTQATLLRARIYRDQGDFTQASATLSEAEPKMYKLLPPGHYAFAALTSEKALLAEAKGDLPTALQLANQAVEIDEEAIKRGGQGATYLPRLLVRRSAVELKLAQADQAVADASRALTLLQATAQPGTYSCNLGRAYLALARSLQAQGKTGQARTAFRSALENLQSTVGPDHPDSRSARQLAEAGTLQE
jgi:eukaryotic-like serine/threonine-protein kinase